MLTNEDFLSEERIEIAEGRSSDVTYYIHTVYEKDGKQETSKDSWQPRWGKPTKANLEKLTKNFGGGRVISAKIVKVNGDVVASVGSTTEDIDVLFEQTLIECDCEDEDDDDDDGGDGEEDDDD